MSIKLSDHPAGFIPITPFLKFGLKISLIMILSFPLFMGEEGLAASPSNGELPEALKLMKELASIKSRAVDLRQVELNLPPSTGALKEAQTLASQGKSLEAISILLPREGKGRDSVRKTKSLFFLTDQLVNEGMDEEALKYLTPIARSLELKKQTISTAQYHLLRLYYRNQKYEDAVMAYSGIQQRLPADQQAHALYLAGNSYMNMMDYLDAVKVLDRIPRKSSFYPFALYASGQSYLFIGDSFSSIGQQFKKLLSYKAKGNPVLSPLKEKTIVTSGYVYLDQKRYEHAVAEFKKVPLSSLYSDQARFGLGWSYAKTGNCAKAITVLETLIKDVPVNPYEQESWVLTGSCYSSLNAHHNAVDTYQKAMEAYSKYKQYLKKAKLQVSSGRMDAWIDNQFDAAAQTGSPPIPKISIPQPAQDSQIIGPERAQLAWQELLEEDNVLEAGNLYVDTKRFEATLSTWAGTSSTSSPQNRSSWNGLLEKARLLKQKARDRVRLSIINRIQETLSNIHTFSMQASIGSAKGISIITTNAKR